MKFYWFIGNKRISETYYRELLDEHDVDFVFKDNAYNKAWISVIFKLAFSQKLNSIIRIPFKQHLFRHLLKSNKIVDSENVVFIFHEGWFDEDILDVLGKDYPNIKTVIYFDDTVETYMRSIPSLDPKKLTDQYDYIMTYDPQDAEKYGFIKCNACFSKLEILPFSDKHSDVCFIGQPKDRYGLIKSITDRISSNCKCDIIVIGDKEGNDGDIVLSKQYMDYEEYLRHEISSNCILEVLKNDTKGATFRCWEAVYYNKKLLTNWEGITSFSYYNPQYMRYFEKPEDIDIEFITDEKPVDYCYRGDNSPKFFLKTIESIIAGEINEKN